MICHWVLTSLLSLHSSYRVAILNKKSKVWRSTIAWFAGLDNHDKSFAQLGGSYFLYWETKKLDLPVLVPRPHIALFFLTQSCFFSLEIDPDMIDVLKNKFLLKMVRSVGEGVMRMMPSSLLELLTEITKLRGQPP